MRNSALASLLETGTARGGAAALPGVVEGLLLLGEAQHWLLALIWHMCELELGLSVLAVES